MQPADDRSVILAMIEHAKHAEALGFAAVFSPDHHFTGYAPWASDAFMFASYLAATLKKAYLGFSVTTVPLHNPVRFAERVNLLDQLSEGRLLVGVGSGTTPEESIGFGVKFQDASRMMEENLSVAEALWNKQIDDEPFQFDTGTYKGAIVQRIAPAAYTKPHARLIGVAMRDSSIERVAKNAWPAFIPAFTPPQLGSLEPFVHFTKWFTKYRNALNSYGHSEQAIQDALSWTTHTYQCVHIAKTDEQAQAELMEILTVYDAAIRREYTYNKRAEEISEISLRPPPDSFSPEWIKTWCLVGSPATVVAELKKYDQAGIGNVLMSFTNGPMTERRAELGKQSIELFAREVMPHFQGGEAKA
jgi:alkanesulfonate monooxygenase SsuD/methylene tetrahydromethanopterin reductase-like flavin-dependent oxidoreductase (luciferase family)